MEDNNNPIPESQEPIQFFDNVQDLAASMQEDAPQPVGQPETSITEAVGEPQEPAQQSADEPVQGPAQPEPAVDEPVQQEVTQPQYTEQDVESAVLNYMSERLGVDINSFDDFIDDGEDEGVNQMDERIEAIARFVEETGRSPQDWFAYQSLNPSEMDDMTAVRVNMASEYPGLNVDELNTLIASKYNMDPDSASEEQIRLAQIQLKADATRAREAIEDIRNGYAAPEVQEQAASDDYYQIDDQWVHHLAYKFGGQRPQVLGH